ncbi:sensor histidine kinase [Sorangium sp. So ce1153]|uniref:sensor histidine kinase n=1 Tax=Sorangium sp. So ce1153 TaxID=3133333 RepID=UPI003F60B89E
MAAARSETRPSRPVLIPRAAMWFGAVAPPFISLLLDEDAIDVLRWDQPRGRWASALRGVAAIALYTNAMLLAHAAAYNAGLARLPLQKLARPVRFGVYGLTTAVVVTAGTLLLIPVLGVVSPDMVEDPLGLIVKGVVLSALWLGVVYMYVQFMARIRTERLLAHREQLAALDARVRLLQVRTNPHFLYNSLNSVMSLIATDPELAEETLGRLARLFRYSLEGSERHVVPLGDELSNVTEYLEVERIRFRERLRYAVLVDPALRSIEVPPMLLQPLVENAVKHGASRRVEGGSVTLRAELAGDDLLLFVLDDGPGPEGSSHRGTGTSLLDLRERLRLLYGEEGRLSAGVGPDGGFMARLRLPARWNR